MAEIGSGRYRVWLQVTEGDIRWTRPAVFNAQEVESSFREWIDQLTPRHYLEMPDSDEGNNDMELWFNKMIHADSSSVDAVTCACDRRADPYWRSCPLGASMLLGCRPSMKFTKNANKRNDPSKKSSIHRRYWRGVTVEQMIEVEKPPAKRKVLANDV